MKEPVLKLGSDLVRLIAEIDEFKAVGKLSRRYPPTASARCAKSPRLRAWDCPREGAKLTDIQVETLLSNIHMRSFTTRDEQEVAGYAEAMMDLVFQAHA
jgi:hypothetical protein